MLGVFDMLVITGKRIKIILSCIFIALFAFSFQVANPSKEENFGNAVQVTTTPASGKTVVIDAGHGVPDEGAYLLH